MDDDDEFVDAIDGREEEQEHEIRLNVHEGHDNGDDDFGDFGDFTEHQDSDGEDYPVHQNYGPEVEESAQQVQRAQVPSNLVIQTTAEEASPSIVVFIYILSLTKKKFLDFKGKTRDEIRREVFAYLEQAHPSPDPAKPPPSDAPFERLDNERAMSLWNQLAAPVPLNPPDWKRSRVRRLFLVSLGIPVNLDEILPAS